MFNIKLVTPQIVDNLCIFIRLTDSTSSLTQKYTFRMLYLENYANNINSRWREIDFILKTTS